MRLKWTLLEEEGKSSSYSTTNNSLAADLYCHSISELLCLKSQDDDYNCDDQKNYTHTLHSQRLVLADSIEMVCILLCVQIE